MKKKKRRRRKLRFMNPIPIGYIMNGYEIGINDRYVCELPVGWVYCDGKKIKDKKSKLYGFNTWPLDNHIMKIK